MPMYLKKDTIRLIEASVDSISMAVTSLGLPQRYELRESSSENAIAVGLAGVSVELAMSSIIVQAQGEQSLHLPSGYYKTGTHIVDNFRALITSQIPKMLFLTQGIKNPAEHISKILKYTPKFKLLTKSRAGGLHAGKGPSRDVCIACVNDVINFINLLGESSRIKPYTETVPRIIAMPKSYDLIIDDLIGKMDKSTSDIDKANMLSSIYLVIPELPEEEPEWVQAFDRLMISPKETDISFLLDTLQNSKYASLIKVAKSADALPVTVQKGNPNALPIEPQYLKKSFSDIRDRWYADRGTANGRLDQKQFDPPPIESVYEIFSLQFHVLQITRSEDELLTATDTWPLVAASLSYPGTLGPYWYFVRKTSDWGQMEAYINRAVKYGGQSLRTGFKEFKPWFDALRKGKALPKTEEHVIKLLSEYEETSNKRKALTKLSEKNEKKDKALCENAKSDLAQVYGEEKSIGEILIKLAENKYAFNNDGSRSYWARVLCEAASEMEDSQGLLAILKSQELSVAHSAARKALRMIDFINFGPKIE
ncbi:hypothetical protein EQM14_07010 [Caproiciproducens sp. NJN-50]|uniref:hypothetical protein n=1 Tax=Caproiciproducens sp. NJN-50 TaxID=2507162 RepID=UPI000FFE2914|nr:hypothetical protein [Caproiciproducens sp. NJN-50]QAT49548.1 hypothetical protein EQM14_07010 [Caproiciproducens sp. NJN-50]